MENKKCFYGCDQDGLFILKNGNLCCHKSPNSCEAMKIRNGKGLKKAYVENRKVSPFKNLTKEERIINGRKGFEVRELNLEDVEFKFRSLNFIKTTLFEEQNGKCNKCGLTEWLGRSITLELEHKDGNSGNNERDNLELLCPNCHSQTLTWRGKNINSGCKKVSDDAIREAIEEYDNIRQVLLAVGLAPKGGNYNRVKKLM